MAIERFEQLEVWKKAHRFALTIYRVTKRLPPDERFGLTAQMRRAAVSVPTNIVEGFKRRGRRDKAHFYNIAQGSVDEVRYLSLLCRDLGHDVEHDEVTEDAIEIGRMLHALMKAVVDGGVEARGAVRGA